jgi:hypothetical protein
MPLYQPIRLHPGPTSQWFVLASECFGLNLTVRQVAVGTRLLLFGGFTDDRGDTNDLFEYDTSATASLAVC